MSPRGQMPYNQSQPRPFRIPQQQPLPQTPSHHNSYGNPFPGFYAPFAANRQSVGSTGFRPSFNMPGFSHLTNSALVDALLTPLTNEQQQEHRPSPYSTPSQEPQPQLKRSRAAVDAWSDESENDEHDLIIEGHRQNNTAGGKKPKRQRRRKSNAQSELDDEYIDAAQTSDIESPARARKPRRSGRPKKSPVPADSLTPEEYGSHLPLKQQKPKKTATAKKQKKPATGRLIRKKPIGITVPKTLAEAGPADRMMWVWKNQGRNWEEIRAEWKRITGLEPGGSSLSVRYIKLLENLARNGAASDIELLRFKKEAEEELLSQVWPRVAEKMLAYSAESEHNPKDLQKRYNMIVRSGYDVEQLLADDDKLKREPEPKKDSTHAPVVDDTQYDGNFDIGLGAMPTYDVPVANEAAGQTGDEVSERLDYDNGRNHGYAYRSELSASSAAPMAPPDVLESVRMLQQQVDGLNDQSFIGDIKYNIPSDHEVGSAISEYNFSSNNLFVAERPASNQSVGQRLPQANNLVNYDSDSE